MSYPGEIILQTKFNDPSKGMFVLVDAISCVVTEERNGEYELEMVYPTNVTGFSEIQEGRYIIAPHDTTKAKQPFCIYKITKVLKGRATINARHISYVKAVVMPGTYTGLPEEIISDMLDDGNAVGGYIDFDVDSDVHSIGTVTVSEPASFRSLLAGSEGSVLDTFGGEYEFDNDKIILHASRGSDNDVTIRYGVNMLDISATIDAADLWIGVVPFWHRNDVLVCGDPQHSSFSHKEEYIPLDLSAEFESQPTVAQLNTKAQAYITANALTEIPLSIDVSFVDLAKSPEYENIIPLQSVKLCDLVTIYHEDFGINIKAKVIRTVYNVLTERYDSVTIGNYRKNLYDIYQQKSTVKSGSIK